MAESGARVTGPLILGKSMVRIDDGQKGVVAQVGEELRIMYIDRGELRQAQKSEKWAPEQSVPSTLRPEERFLIAATCDRALRAYECNEPHKTWEPLTARYLPYDPGLMEVVQFYLSQRKK
jgi:hypothetical protein